MKILPAIFLLFLIGFVTEGLTEEIREIELKDGSVIFGEIISYSNGTYTVKSNSLGTITLKDSKINGIKSKGAGNITKGDYNAKQEKNGTTAQIQAVQRQMMKNENIIKTITSLQNDPDFQKILQDPSIMKAINAGDISVLTSNPEFMKLMNKSAVRDITNNVAK